LHTISSLRAATDQQHQRLHHHPALAPLTETTVRKAQYLSALSSFYGFYKPLEEKFCRCDDPLFAEFEKGDNVERLSHDLAHHGVDTAQLRLLPLDDTPFTREQALGYLYLREGSALGGQLISKKLSDNLALVPGRDNTFFFGKGKLSAAEWKKYIDKLQEIDAAGLVDSAAAAAFAGTLFSALETWLTQENNANDR